MTRTAYTRWPAMAIAMGSLWILVGCGATSFQEKPSETNTNNKTSGQTDVQGGQTQDSTTTKDPSALPGKEGTPPVQVDQPLQPGKRGNTDTPGGAVGGNAGGTAGGNAGGTAGGNAGGAASGSPGGMGGNASGTAGGMAGGMSGNASGNAGGTAGGMGGNASGTAGGTAGGMGSTAGGGMGGTAGGMGGTAGGMGGTAGGMGGTPGGSPNNNSPVLQTDGVAGGVDGTVVICLNYANGHMVVHDIGVPRWFAANFNYVVNTTTGPVSLQWQPKREVATQLPGKWMGICNAAPVITKFRPLQTKGRRNPPRWWLPSKYNQGTNRCVAIDDGDDGRPGAVEVAMEWNLTRCQ